MPPGAPEKRRTALIFRALHQGWDDPLCLSDGGRVLCDQVTWVRNWGVRPGHPVRAGRALAALETVPLTCGGSGIRTHGDRGLAAFQERPLESGELADYLLTWAFSHRSSTQSAPDGPCSPEFMDRIMDSELERSARSPAGRDCSVSLACPARRPKGAVICRGAVSDGRILERHHCTALQRHFCNTVRSRSVPTRLRNQELGADPSRMRSTLPSARIGIGAVILSLALGACACGGSADGSIGTSTTAPNSVHGINPLASFKCPTAEEVTSLLGIRVTSGSTSKYGTRFIMATCDYVPGVILTISNSEHVSLAQFTGIAEKNIADLDVSVTRVPNLGQAAFIGTSHNLSANDGLPVVSLLFATGGGIELVETVPTESSGAEALARHLFSNQNWQRRQS